MRRAFGVIIVEFDEPPVVDGVLDEPDFLGQVVFVMGGKIDDDTVAKRNNRAVTLPFCRSVVTMPRSRSIFIEPPPSHYNTSVVCHVNKIYNVP